MVKVAWLQRYDMPPGQHETIRIVQSWDTASKAKQINDPSVCTTWAETRRGTFLLDVFRRRMEYPDLKRMAISLHERWKPHAVLIEDKSSGQALIQELRTGSKVPVIPIEPEADKITRLVAVSPLIESGRVHLPCVAPWLPDYEVELLSFPNAPNDDQVDSTSQALAWMRGRASGLSYESASAEASDEAVGFGRRGVW